MRIVTLFLLSALLHGLVGLRLVPDLTALPSPAGPALALVLGLWLAASSVLLPLGLMGRRRTRADGEDLLTWLGLVAMGLFSSLFVLTLMRDAVLLALGAAGALGLGVGAAAAAPGSAAAVLVGALVLTTVGYVNARRLAGVREVQVPIADLPEPLHGFTIVQISDVHVGPTIRGGTVERIVEAVNRLSPDVVAVTGDLVDGSVDTLSTHVAPLAGLRSRHGTYFVTGNHEYYSGAHAWIEALPRWNVRVLMNEHVVLEHGPARLLLAGVADWSAHHFDPRHRSDPAAALAGAPADVAARVLLAHQPRSAAAAAAAGFQLQLSGHTHGGQFWPWNHFVRFQQPWVAGLQRLDRLWVYVSRGTGYWGPPKRFGAPSEITRLRLVPGHPA